jgi:hypothetical protein
MAFPLGNKMGGGGYHAYITIPLLKERMQALRISRETMEARSGVCMTTIRRARAGFRIRKHLADCIVEVLRG